MPKIDHYARAEALLDEADKLMRKEANPNGSLGTALATAHHELLFAAQVHATLAACQRPEA